MLSEESPPGGSGGTVGEVDGAEPSLENTVTQDETQRNSAQLSATQSNSQKFINPHRLFYGSFLPEWLEGRVEISPEAKMVYARLCRYAGARGYAFPRQQRLADDIGRPLRTVQRAVAELLKNKLIWTYKPGWQSGSVYLFPWHPWMETAVSPEEAPRLEEELPFDPSLAMPPRVAGLGDKSPGKSLPRSPAAAALESKRVKKIEEEKTTTTGKRTLDLTSGAEWMMDIWNAATKTTKLRRCLKLTQDRRKKAASRLEEHSREEIERAVNKIAESSFCNGGGERGWTADFDFLIRPNTISRALEGRYDSWKAPARRAGPDVPDSTREALRKLSIVPGGKAGRPK